MSERMVATPLGRVRVQVRGDGPTMLFWPSLLMTGDLWAGQAAHFAVTRRVVLVDPPGHGGSEPLTRGFTFDECAATIAAILDALDVSSADVVGNSWGGMVGATFAATYPDRVHHAVLMNCTGSPAGRRQRLEYGALLALARLRGGVRPPLTRSVLRAFLGPTTFRTRPDVVAAVRRAAESVDIASGQHAVRSVVPQRPDQSDLLGRITAPTLVVAGREDATFPVAETEAMAARIPGSRFVVLDGVAHLAAAEDPAAVNRLIEEFVTSGA